MYFVNYFDFIIIKIDWKPENRMKIIKYLFEYISADWETIRPMCLVINILHVQPTDRSAGLYKRWEWLSMHVLFSDV